VGFLLHHSLLWSWAFTFCEVDHVFISRHSLSTCLLVLAIEGILLLLGHLLFVLCRHLLLFVCQEIVLAQRTHLLLCQTILFRVLWGWPLDRVYVGSWIVDAWPSIRVLNHGLLFLGNTSCVHGRIVLGLVMRVGHALILLQVYCRCHRCSTLLLTRLPLLLFTYSAYHWVHLFRVPCLVRTSVLPWWIGRCHVVRVRRAWSLGWVVRPTINSRDRVPLWRHLP